MKTIHLSIMLLLISAIIYSQDLTLRDLTVEYQKNPTGIDTRTPRFTWNITGTGTGTSIIQTAYSIRVSAGLDSKSPGYKQFLIKPYISDKYTYAKASFESLYGTAASGWERKDGKIIAKITKSGSAVVGNKKFLSVGKENDRTAITVGSGEYVFEFAE